MIAGAPTARVEPLTRPLRLEALPERPLVSVLIANHNYAEYVRAAMESVLAQRYARLELIVCDDGSTDGSVERIEWFVERDRRVKLVRKNNGGQASAWNAAFRQ